MSPRPHTKRGRTTTVSRPSAFAARTTSSALAFEDGYSDGESGRSGAVSSTFTSGCPAISAASVPTCTSRRTPAARQASTTLRVPCTFTRSKSAGSPKSSTFAAAWKAISQSSIAEVVQVAHHRLGAELAHALRGALGARQRAHVPALAPEPLDQRAAHEAGSAGYERGGHLSARRAGRSRRRRRP